MTDQQVFDKVVRHLRKQGRPSIDKHGACAYRAPGGLKCAVGALIPDGVYSRGMENNVPDLNTTVHGTADGIVRYVLEGMGVDIDLARSLQAAHDLAYRGGGWMGDCEERLRSVAELYGLRYTPPRSK